ncbi:MAG: DUF6152 family protein [Cucumibacter sp.]
MQQARRKLLSLLAATALAAACVPALAHHGWSWTGEEFFELTDTLTDIYVGNPHATLELDVDGVVWRVELAPLNQTLNAGFDETAVALGAEVTVIGHRSLDPNEPRMKAVRVIVGDKTYDVYPDRAVELPSP